MNTFLRFVPYIVDFLLVVIVGICIVNGYRRGLLRSLLSFLGIILCFAAATWLSGRLSGVVFTSFIRPGMIASVQENISSHADLSGLKELMSSGLVAMLTAIGMISESTLNSVVSKIDYLSDPAAQAESIVDNALAEPVTQLIRILLFIIILILALIILKALLSLSSSFNNIPVLGGFNRFLGILLGLVEGVAIVYALVYVAKTALATTPDGAASLDTLNANTVVFKLLSSIDIF